MKENQPLNSAQLISEILVIAGYVIGIIPAFYYFTIFWVVPLTVLNVVLAILSKNKTEGYTIINFVMSILSLIPILGYIAIITGISMSSMAISTINKAGGVELGSTKKSKGRTIDIEPEEKKEDDDSEDESKKPNPSKKSRSKNSSIDTE